MFYRLKIKRKMTYRPVWDRLPIQLNVVVCFECEKLFEATNSPNTKVRYTVQGTGIPCMLTTFCFKTVKSQ